MEKATDRIQLGSILILESPVKDGQYITGNPAEEGFKPYDGKNIPFNRPSNDRMITMRTSFTVNPSLKNIPLSLYFGPGSYPYMVYLNGRLLIKIGRYENGYNSTIYRSYNILLPRDNLKTGNEENELAVQSFPMFGEVNPFSPLVLGSFDTVEKEVFWRNFFALTLIQASFILSLVIALFFFLLFLVRGSQDKPYFYFSLVCIAFSVGYSNMSLYHDAANQLLLEKFSRTGLPATGAILSIFIMEYLGIFKKGRILKSLILLSIPLLAVLVFIQKDKAGMVTLFQYITSYYLTPILLFTVVILVVGLFTRKTRGSWILFLGFLASVLASLHDIYYISTVEIPYAWLVPYGYMLMVISIFFLLALELASIYQKSLEREKELDVKNSSLNRMMDQIGQVSESLIFSSRKLEENLGSTISVVENYGDSNRKILDEFIVQFTGVEHEINQIAQRIDVSGEKIPRAITNQTAVVEQVNHTLSEMNSHIESTMRSASESDAVARNLSDIAEKSTRTISKSRDSIARVSEYSQFIREVLNAIQDITEKTNILSMNASIEATKAGVYGKGFAVVAGEIRKLAKQSRDSLASSFDKIKEMGEVIQDSNTLSSQVSESLSRIIEESKQSAENIGKIHVLIEDQERQSAEILGSVKSLFDETVVIRDLSLEEQKYNIDLKSKLLDMKKKFSNIADLLKAQEEKKTSLYSSLSNIREVMEENLKNIEILNGSISSNGGNNFTAVKPAADPVK